MLLFAQEGKEATYLTRYPLTLLSGFRYLHIPVITASNGRDTKILFCNF